MGLSKWTFLAATSLLTACATSLEVRPDSGIDYTAGIPVTLPFTQYTVTETWRLASCEAENAQPVSLKVEAVAGEAEDSDHRYLVDPASLQGAATVSEFEIAYFDDSAMPHTINASVEDRSGAIIGNVVKTVASVAPLFFGVPPGIRAVEEGPLACTAGAAEQRRIADERAVDLERINGEVASATAAALRIAAVAARLGSAIDEGTRRRYAEAVRRLDELTATQAATVQLVEEALRPLTFQRVSRWPSRSGDLTREPGLIDASTVRRWFGVAAAPEGLPAVHLALTDPAGNAPAAAAAPAAPPAGDEHATPVVHAGIPFRSPRPGRLWACNTPCASADETKLRVLVDGPVAQLGRVNVLPVRNHAFGSAAVSAEFRRNGSLANASFAQRAAPLEQASAAAAGAAGALAPLFDPTARLERETAYLNALKTRREAQHGLEPVTQSGPAAARGALDEDTALLNAQISNLEARLALQELQARAAAE